MITRSIPKEKWRTVTISGRSLATIFDEDFAGSDLPEKGDIIGCYEDGKLVGFILAEPVLFIGQIFVTEEHRKENGGSIVKKLVRHVRDKVPDGLSVAAVASEPRFAALYKSFGMEKIAGTLFRRN